MLFKELMVESRVVSSLSKGPSLCLVCFHQLWSVYSHQWKNHILFYKVFIPLIEPVSFLMNWKGLMGMFMCGVHECLHLCGCTSVCKYKYIYMWRPEVNPECYPQVFFILCFEARSLSKIGTHQFI